MDALDKYLAGTAPEARKLMRALDALIRKAAPGLSSSLKWGNLTYHHASNVCAIVAHKQYINLQVWGGANVADPGGLLIGSGKSMRHIKFAIGKPFNRRAVAAIVRAAARDFPCPVHRSTRTDYGNRVGSQVTCRPNQSR
jgi:hypothetical protein